jgi:ABC-type molybdate transport system substrate-binding protein
MEIITELEKELRREIKELILGETKPKKELVKKLKEFFHLKTQKDIDKIDPKNIRLFTVALEILENNKKLSPVNLANLDHVYSYGEKSLKYSWKSCELNILKETSTIKKILMRISKELRLTKKEKQKIDNFVNQAEKISKEKYTSDIKQMGIINKSKDAFIFLEYTILDDDYHKERISEFNIFLASEKLKLLEILPNNKGNVYSSLVFQEKN